MLNTHAENPQAARAENARHSACLSVREEMLRCLYEASREEDEASKSYLVGVFMRVGVDFEKPDSIGLERVLSVLRADAFRLGRSVEIIQANVAKLYQMLEQATPISSHS